ALPCPPRQPQLTCTCNCERASQPPAPSKGEASQKEQGKSEQRQNRPSMPGSAVPPPVGPSGQLEPPENAQKAEQTPATNGLLTPRGWVAVFTGLLAVVGFLQWFSFREERRHRVVLERVYFTAGPDHMFEGWSDRWVTIG